MRPAALGPRYTLISVKNDFSEWNKEFLVLGKPCDMGISNGLLKSLLLKAPAYCLVRYVYNHVLILHRPTKQLELMSEFLPLNLCSCRFILSSVVG